MMNDSRRVDGLGFLKGPPKDFSFLDNFEDLSDPADPQQLQAHYLFVAELAETSERYDELFYALQQLSKLPVPIHAQQSNLLSIAFKNILSPIRTSLKTINRRALQEKLSGTAERADVIGNLGNLILEEFRGKVEQFLELTKRFRKMTCELEGEVQLERPLLLRKCLECYEEAWKRAAALPATHPTRLDLAIYLASYYAEVLQDTPRACSFAQGVIQEAERQLEEQTGEEYRKVESILSILKDYLTDWSSFKENDSPHFRE